MKHILTTLCLLLALTLGGVAQNAPTKLEGQIVCCTDCWNRADRKTVPYGTPADLVKASDCMAKGDPTLLAVELNGGAAIAFYQLEDGRYKKPGKNWLELVGSRVEITGVTRSK